MSEAILTDPPVTVAEFDAPAAAIALDCINFAEPANVHRLAG